MGKAKTHPFPPSKQKKNSLTARMEASKAKRQVGPEKER